MPFQDPLMSAYYNYRIIALSVVVSIVAAYAARDLTERVREARGRSWVTWLASAAIVDGIGVWSMHYTGMLALHLPVPFWFDWHTVLLSLLVGIFGSAGALLVVSRRHIGWPQVLAASIFLGGVGISGMHYTAMGAMRFQGMDHHSPPLASLAILLAIGFALMSLILTFLFPSRSQDASLRLHAAALFRGLANPVMHYTAMAAVIWTYSSELPDLSHTVSISSLGILGISIVPAMVIIVALMTSIVDRLQKQRTYLHELFEQAPQAVVLMDKDNQIVRVNRDFTRLFGYTARETIGRHLNELIIPDELQELYQTSMDLVARGQRVDLEGLLNRKDSSRIYVAKSYVPMSLPGGQTETYAIFRDITERKKAEESLQQAQARTESVLASIADTYILLDRQWRYLYVNESGVRAIGRPREEILASTLWELYPDIVGTELEYQYHRAMEERLPAVFDFYYPTTNTWWANRLYPASEGLAVFATNISEQKRAEADSERLFDELSQSHEQLKILSSRLVEVEESERKRLAREIHDDISQSLTALMMQLGSALNLLPKSARAVRSILEETEALTQNTLEHTRLMIAGLRPSILDELGLGPALHRLADELHESTGARVTLKANRLPKRLPPQMEIALFRIVQEALTNIRKHAQASEVTIELTKKAGRVFLSVQDNGIGIGNQKAEIREGDNAVLAGGWEIPAGHFGLIGLQERVKSLGGNFQLASAPNQGTTIRVELPL